MAIAFDGPDANFFGDEFLDVGPVLFCTNDGHLLKKFLVRGQLAFKPIEGVTFAFDFKHSQFSIGHDEISSPRKSIDKHLRNESGTNPCR